MSDTIFPSNENFNSVDWLEFKKKEIEFLIKKCETNISRFQNQINSEREDIEGYKKGIQEILKSIDILKPELTKNHDNEEA